MASAGEKYVYDPEHGKGFGEAAKGDVLSAEMMELDLKPGTEVEFLHLDDVGWPLIQWVDGVGIDRITAVDPAMYEADFRPAGGTS